MDSKTLNFRCIVARVLLIVTFLGLSSWSFAQKNVSGTVSDENGQPIPGVAVVLKGTTNGTITDFDGKYSLSIPAGQENGQMSFLYIGYETLDFPIPSGSSLNVKMVPSVTELNEVVAIGYGTKRKGDLTGSIASVSEKDFNGGVVSSPEQLINGKVAGVQIMSNGGSPSAGSTIKIRGGASLNASNNPLIVLDGVPLENGGISGNSDNFLALINPADIESMTVLKDASSTAIYGSRASNGVIIITTKKGSRDKVRVTFNTTNSVAFKTRTADMLSRDEFVDVVNGTGDQSLIKFIGDADTDWNDEIFRPAFGTDNNVSVSGTVAKILPVRVSVGCMAQDGILLNDNTKRYTGNINLNPSFLNDALKVNFSMKASMNKNSFADYSAIYNASVYNPTIPVYSGNKDLFMGYTEAYTMVNGVPMPITGSVKNPVGLLEYQDSESTVQRLITNLDVDYTFPFCKDLKAHVTGGLDLAKGEGSVYIPAEAMLNYNDKGRDYEYGPEKNSNKLFTGYVNYAKKNDLINFDLTAGYDYQYWNSNAPYFEYYTTEGAVMGSSSPKDQTHVLMSYYGRANATFLGKYMATATVRRDGTSRFSKDERWGTFPSVALAWRISEEEFMQGISDIMNNLKIRASYGVTGQQDGIGNYNYLATYTLSQPNSAAYYLWNGNWIPIYYTSSYVENLKWESTKAWNIGIDFGFLNDKVTGSIEYYSRTTEDLLATVPAAAGSNFASSILTNVGNVDSKGLELSVNYNVLRSADWGLDMSLNATWEKNEVTNLSINKGGDVVNNPAGPAIDSDQFQTLTEGQTPYSFWLYHQIYDVNGNPIEGAYVDSNNDGIINDADKYYCHSPAPDWMLAYSLSLRYRKFTLSTSLRANIGNYVYNGIAAQMGAIETMKWNDGQINNISASYLASRFNSRQYQSDYYLHNASFLKMDNISLSYNFGRIADIFSLNATLNVQNVFTVTKYNGVDPEIGNGVDKSFYPRPRTFSLSLGFQF